MSVAIYYLYPLFLTLECGATVGSQIHPDPCHVTGRVALFVVWITLATEDGAFYLRSAT